MNVYEIKFNYYHPHSFGMFLSKEQAEYWNAIQNIEGDETIIEKHVIYEKPYAAARVGVDTKRIAYWSDMVYGSTNGYPKLKQKGPKNYLYVAVPLGPLDQMTEEVMSIFNKWDKEHGKD